MPSNKGTSRRKRDALTPHYCEIPFCGYSRVFQRHRIVPGREGGRYKLGNVIALCPNCHAEADRGWISREYLLEIVRQRIERDAAFGINRAAVFGTDQDLSYVSDGEAVGGVSSAHSEQGRPESDMRSVSQSEESHEVSEGWSSQ